MKKNIAIVIAAAVAVISTISLIALVISVIGVRVELGAGYELAHLESLSPYGNPETPEEIQANVKASYANEGIFLRMASGNVGKTETTVIVAFMFLSLVGSVSGLIYSEKAATEAAKKKEREMNKAIFRQKMEELGC